MPNDLDDMELKELIETALRQTRRLHGETLGKLVIERLLEVALERLQQVEANGEQLQTFKHCLRQ